MSRRPSRSRLAVAIAGACLLAVAAALVTSWPALERRLHLERLRRDPGLLEALLLAESPPRRAAAEDFLREPAGRRELFRLYLLELDRTSSGMRVRDILLRERDDPTRRGLISLHEDGIHHQMWSLGARSHSSYALVNVPLDAARRKRLLELVERLAGEIFTAEGFEGLEFQIRTVIGGRFAPPEWEGVAAGSEWLPWTSPNLPPGARHACYYRAIARK